ncbi:thiol reductant ABC exporter subunit CydC [Saccharococcus sp. Marseille-Q5394]|uniref:thiol reductant ABC exporter subunit CydC n=1 Tax=Saccharococcus sp. Marseille-Q5394 TaxID=2972778 RepID=UPI0021CA1E18|nr:thiol reductant ABC exporter subunit CydC [Saccharococcus sp. Marseille-Q5394]
MRTWIIPYMKQHKGRMLLTVLVGVLGVASSVMLLFISGYLISKSALRPENIMIVYVPIVAVRAFSISQAVMRYLERLIGHDVILRILERMRTRLYRVLQPQALVLQSRYKTGDLLSMLSEDIEHLQDFYLRTVFPSILSLFVYGALIGVLGLFDWVFALMMALVLAIIVFVIPFISLLVTRRKYIALKQGRNQLYAQLTDAVFGLSDWIASGRIESFLSDYKTDERDLLEIEKRMNRWQHVRNAIVQLVIGIAVMAMIAWAGNQAETGQIAPTVIAAFALMMLAITDALSPASEAIERIPAYEESLRRLQEVETETNDAPGHAPRSAAAAIREANGPAIEMQNVSYRYPESKEDVISGMTLTIDRGKKVAILGRSGTGKSTLLKLLTGALQPTAGNVFINGEQASQSLLAKSLSILNQKSHLFDTTVENNIRIGNPEASDEEISEVVEQAQLTKLLASIPTGLKTPMEEMGHRFSGGERQRIAFARVLLQQTPIVIFDEPTIGLDPKTEHDLLQTMFDAAKDKTVIWVTHHLAGIEQMDEIIFLEEGNIVLQGNHENLLATSSKYRALYEMDKGI